jgi:hypothetical protein
MKQSVDQQEEELRAELIGAMLHYLEGRKTYRSVLELGITAHNKDFPLKNQNIAEVVSDLNSLGNEIANGVKYSNTEIVDKFTTMLQLLTRDKTV